MPKFFVDVARPDLGGRKDAVPGVVLIDPATGAPAAAGGGVSDATSVLLAFKGYGEATIASTNESTTVELPENDGAISIRATKEARFLLGDGTVDASEGGHYIAAGERLDLRVGAATHIAVRGTAGELGTIFISGLGRPAVEA